MSGLCFNVHGTPMPRWLSHMSKPGIERSRRPAPMRDRRLGVADGLQLLGDPAAVQRARDKSRACRPTGPAEIASNAASAASIADFIAVCVPLIRGTFTNPAEQPISAPPGKDQLGNGLVAALVDRSGAVGHAAAAFDLGADRRMGLPALHLLERREIGVRIVERDDEAERDLVVFLMVEKPAAPGILEAASLGCGSLVLAYASRQERPTIP